MIGRKQLENVEYFSCLGSTITNDARCACEIQSTRENETAGSKHVGYNTMS